MKKSIELFLTFLKIGAFTFGGGYAMIPLIQKEVCENKKWLSEKDISDRLYTANIPDPDLIIRTGGEHRLSNFMLYQAAYSEFYSTDTLWPDFSEKDFQDAILEFNKRSRRFGGV